MAPDTPAGGHPPGREAAAPQDGAAGPKTSVPWQRLLLAFLMLVLVAGSVAGWEAYRFLHVPPESPGKSVTVTIEPGLALARIGQLLEEERVVSSGRKFRIYAQAKGLAASVQSGEFVLHTGLRPRQVLETLVSGKILLHRLLIPEGLTWWQVARLVEQSGLASFESFAQAVADLDLLMRFDIPASHAEGFLFPETYSLPRPRNQDARPIVEMMLANFWKVADARLWPDGRPSNEDIRKAVVLASLVERETGLAEERERVAGVFANRLRLGMLLQCDPTIIYGLGPNFSGRLRRVHLDDQANPYNTYIHPGLPPGPIASPGLASLMAVRNPEKHDLLYFVSKKDGSHAFSRTLEEHNRAVRRYQLGR